MCVLADHQPVNHQETERLDIGFLVDPGAVVSAISLQCYEKLVETDAILMPMAMQMELEAANKSDSGEGTWNVQLGTISTWITN